MTKNRPGITKYQASELIHKIENLINPNLLSVEQEIHMSDVAYLTLGWDNSDMNLLVKIWFNCGGTKSLQRMLSEARWDGDKMKQSPAKELFIYLYSPSQYLANSYPFTKPLFSND